MGNIFTNQLDSTIISNIDKKKVKKPMKIIKITKLSEKQEKK